jgi:hypothetical protein
VTTRQRLNRRTFAGLFALIVVGVVLGISNQYVERGSDLDITLRTVGILLVVAWFGYKWITPCVQCHQPMRWMGFFWRPSASALQSPKCPHCGWSIDKDVPGARGF